MCILYIQVFQGDCHLLWIFLNDAYSHFGQDYGCMQDLSYADDLVFPAAPKPSKDKKKPVPDKSKVQNEDNPETQHCSIAEMFEVIKAEFLLPMGSSYLCSK